MLEDQRHWKYRDVIVAVSGEEAVALVVACPCRHRRFFAGSFSSSGVPVAAWCPERCHREEYFGGG